MGVTVTFQRQTRFELSNGRHVVITDQPKEDGGEDAGMTPVEHFVHRSPAASVILWLAIARDTRSRLKGFGSRLSGRWPSSRIGSAEFNCIFIFRPAFHHRNKEHC